MIAKIRALFFAVIRLFVPQPVRRKMRQWLRAAFGFRARRKLQEHRAALAGILAENQGKPLIIIAPSLDWDVQLFQRPQQIALALARQGALVFYMQPKPDLKQPPFLQYRPAMYLCNVYHEAFQVIPCPLVYVLTWNSDFLSCFDRPRAIYDYVDDVNVFYGDHNAIVAGHKRLLAKAEFVMATAEKLYEEASQHRPDVLFSPNGVEIEHFCRYTLQAPPVPEDMQPVLERRHPVIGYYGALARWFDYDLLRRLSALRPDYEFVLIGPDYDGTLNPTGILKLPNVHWLGVKKYTELPDYLYYFDVATIPFQINDITHATSPLKLFEYMAGGKPVVITPMHESMRYPGVLVGATPEEFAAQLDRALELRSDPDHQRTLREVAEANTWDERARQLLQAVAGHRQA